MAIEHNELRRGPRRTRPSRSLTVRFSSGGITEGPRLDGPASVAVAPRRWFALTLLLLGLAAPDEAETDQPRTEQGEACRLRHGCRPERLSEVAAAAIDVDRSKAAGARGRGHACGG